MEAQQINSNSAAKACLACRNKHVKCDGKTPCQRCADKRADCVYVASRRGYYGRRSGYTPRDVTRQGSSVAASSDIAAIMSSIDSPSTQLLSSPLPGFTDDDLQTPAANQLHKVDMSIDKQGQIETESFRTTPLRASTLDETINAFYYYSFPAHPFVLPKHYLSQSNTDPEMAVLLPAMRWIGSLFLRLPQAVKNELFSNAYRCICEPTRPRNGYLVQAMLLLVIGLDGTCNRDSSVQLLKRLEMLAIEIKLHHSSFAMIHSNGMAVLEESWRRTWWELYVVDGMIAGVHRLTNFALYRIDTDVPLPCEEDDYLLGNIPSPSSLLELEDDSFSSEEKDFSSFAYRILCARNMGKLIELQPISQYAKEAISGMEASLASWQLHLPPSKRHALLKNGKHDEMMFQAFMMFNATSILLHQPLSQLDGSVVQTINACASPKHLHSEPGKERYNSHFRHAVDSATAISDLISHRTAMLGHSHFFACVVTLSSIVHFSHWALRTDFFSDTTIATNDPDCVNLRQYIKLNIGALKAFASVWSAADEACRQVQSVAQEIYRLKRTISPETLLWGERIEENLEQALAVDDTLWQMWNSLT